MIILLFALILSLNVNSAYAQEIKEIKPLYQLPQKAMVSEETASMMGTFLVGSDSGLYRVTPSNNVLPLWVNGRVDQILNLEFPSSDGTVKPAWLLRTDKGIFVTYDLEVFEERNNGLSFLTIKKYKNKEKTLEKQIQELKDVCANPLNNNELVTATKDNVYYSNNAGQTWTNLNSMSKTTSGVKAVAIATFDGETVVFMSHPIFGLSYTFPNRKKIEWFDVEEGFEKMKSLSSPDEIADIYPVLRTQADGTVKTEIYISQTYIPRIYRFNWEEKKRRIDLFGK